MERDKLWLDSCAAALATLPGMGPIRLRALLLYLSPDAAWQMLAEGGPMPTGIYQGPRDDDLFKKWRSIARSLEPWEVMERNEREGVSVWTRYGTYPARLIGDEHA